MKITGLSINCMEYQQDFWMSSASANQIYNKRFCILVRIMTDEGIVGIGGVRLSRRAPLQCGLCIGKRTWAQPNREKPLRHPGHLG